jgi:hemerythrin-like domain-containing protein
MLLKHIDKEDNAIFNLAERKLDSSILNKLDKDFEDIEAMTENEKTRNKYIEFANSL